MKKLVVDHSIDADSLEASGERWKWNVDQQGRVTHSVGFSAAYHHQAKTLYVRDMGRWQKLGYWCDRCRVGLLLEQGKSGRAGFIVDPSPSSAGRPTTSPRLTVLNRRPPIEPSR